MKQKGFKRLPLKNISFVCDVISLNSTVVLPKIKTKNITQLKVKVRLGIAMKVSSMLNVF
jgi:hypothetical protein